MFSELSKETVYMLQRLGQFELMDRLLDLRFPEAGPIVDLDELSTEDLEKACGI